MNEEHRQRGYSLRFDWGPAGAEAIVPGCAVAVVVDVLSFTTTLSVAADRGVTVYPFRWRDERARRFAEEHDAVLAAGRSEGGISLSPVSVRDAPDLRRLVLPSPNGSTISAALADRAPVVVGASLRNRRAVTAWLTARRERDPGPVAVVASGERWPDGSLRPAVEDLWGAGALITALLDAGWDGASPEARAAAAAFAAMGDPNPALHDCAGGRELAAVGFSSDVDVAAELDVSPSVPVLSGGAFTARARSARVIDTG
ncbi:2-phosphosulfolactate phosphatase [Pseudonocardia endophytica]|uniref:Probable 2-phosphosulfolactate phosphatase n=1 Tax=Pseudonocardia endophytica TaxID=401976 RepID=A0A4R1HXS8_PSEEN|nr:2-phosphosulfolactate phosphatase [Pseudonocardia endophytica]TCK25925.1 2-phosphosulfolactate phosphatase [Pseudonocardia endophytica]